MKRSRPWFVALPAIGFFAVLALVGALISAEPTHPTQQDRDAVHKKMTDGNFKDAYEGYRRLALNKSDDPKKVGDDLREAILCLLRLGRADEIDDFREKVIDVHKADWRLLLAAANSYFEFEHNGQIIAGKFSRGYNRGGGQWAYAFEHDRVRALQLMQRAFPLLDADSDGAAKADFYIDLAQSLMSDRGFNEAWELQVLTDITTLPDYSQGWNNNGGPTRGAPVDDAGNPVYYTAVKHWKDAANDGQRWRWALAQAVEMSPAELNTAKMELADFLHNQFGVQTMGQFGFFGRGGEDAGNKQGQTGPFAVHSLGEDETIARLATGVKRFKLPDEFNFIKIYQAIADNPKTGSGEAALDQLAQIFENRQQYPKAADYWRRSIKEYGPGSNNYKKQRLDQIVGNWGRFDPGAVQPAGRGGSVEFTYRNGKHVSFEARAIKVEKLLDDVKGYLNSHPAQPDWQKFNLQDIGYRLVTQNEQQYVGAKVASWELDLDPPAEHFDRQNMVATPLQKAGAYLLSAKMADGNTSRIVVWLADTAIVEKHLSNGLLYVVADALTGKPVPKMNVELFGYRQRFEQPNKWFLDTKDFAEFSNADGEVIVDKGRAPQDFAWVAIARGDKASGDGGRLAYVGFSNVWYGNNYDIEYNQTKVFTITDRPVYRPGQLVKFKFWIEHAEYDKESTSDFANQSFKVELHDPKGQKIFEKILKSDAYGGIEGDYELSSTATLGDYQLFASGGWEHRTLIVGNPPAPQDFQVGISGGGSFRVEEYKKPEFEVTIDAPTEPVMLGEKIKATIKAKYYFGSPVVHAKVKYKILRSSYAQTWYPPGPWDWFYGPGYWWFGYNYDWFPGWNDWGCRRPIGWWWGNSYQPPEVVADAEAQIGADGTLSIDIDTALAKAVHPDQDQRYEITAEVVDASRRTIVGTGTVLVARKPFQVTAWVDRGYYHTGDAIVAQFAGRTLDGKPVKGTGHLVLYKVTYPGAAKPGDESPVEKAVEKWNVDTDAQGEARQQMKAAEPGQYRLSYKLTDAKGHTIEGGYVFTVTGPDFTGASYRFNDLELIPDRREYAAGDKVKLMINTNRTDGTIWLFLRPANGVYLPPKLLRLDGKSTIVDIDVSKHDMPNFFVEALTISGGKTFSEMKEIVVPPEQRILNVAVDPTKTEYRPGDKASVGVKLTDLAGKPFVGSTVVAIYDKAVEYISGGSNVPEIRAFFWQWRRMHSPQQQTNLSWVFGNLLRPGETGMNNLGVFGYMGNVFSRRGAHLSGLGGEYRQERLREAGIGENADAAAAPAPGAANGAMDSLQMAKGEDKAAGDEFEKRDGDRKQPSGPAPALVQPTIRSNFADTALWVGALETNAKGEAEVSLNMPENLTTWKVKVWGMGHGTKVGEGSAEVVTRKDLIIRLEAPRFFVEKDEVVLSGDVHNYLKTKKQVQVALEMPGHHLAPMADLVRTVEVPAGGEMRVDWRVKVVGEGEATVRMKALTDEESDAVEQKFPVYVHGMLKMDSFSGALRPKDSEGKITFNVPAERRQSDSVLEVRYSPTLAGAMVDALPYLADYPYDCTEQTLNRFLPTVITQKILIRMGLDLKKIQEKRTNLNAQEIGDDRARAAGWKRFDRNPVFDNEEVTRMVKSGVERLEQMQLADGGWGWFSGIGEQSWPHTTATVVHGLQVARANDVALVPGVMDRGVEWLRRYQERQVQLLENALTKPQPTTPYKTTADNLDAFVYMVLIDAGVKNPRMMDFLYRDRIHLAVYAKALFGLALEKQADQKEKLAMILQNIRQFVVEDNEDQTAYLKLPENNYWWLWFGSEVEANAYYLKLLTRTDPKGELAPRLVKYLLNNRKHATYWNSTRDTGLAIEALAEYLRVSGEDKPDVTVEILLDGKKQKDVHITAADLFTFDNKFVLRGDAVTTGKHELQLRKTGSGPLYYNAYLTTFTLEDWIGRAGLEVRVNRKIYKLERDDKTIQVAGGHGQAVGQRVEKYKRTELKNLDMLKSGDLVEVELEIDSKNDYEYVIFEDMKAAGFEPVEVRSGYAGNALGAYMELRDNRVSFFLHELPRGKHSVSYRLRAEIPGRYSALPARASAMYAPELKGNSDEIKLQIED